MGFVGVSRQLMKRLVEFTDPRNGEIDNRHQRCSQA
jgi:hypothetical protein